MTTLSDSAFGMTPPPCVPYFVLRLENDNGVTSSTCYRAKVMFTVPSELAVSLATYPILCRGSSFALDVDDGSATAASTTELKRTDHQHPTTTATATTGSNGNYTAFLTTILESPRPEETAQDIAQRIAVRMEHIDSFQIATADGFLGF